MDMLTASQANGDIVTFRKLYSRHLDLNKELSQNNGREGTQKSFSNVLMDSLNEVNKAQIDSGAITEAYLLDPDSVEAHDVTIAMAKANMTLNVTKSIVDKAVKSYKEIISLR